MAIDLLRCSGGTIVLPDTELTLVSREDGGNLIVNPPRDVWERSLLSAEELRDWGALVAATGHAMLRSLPQLEGGCINYWEAGNWALNDKAEPRGPKRAPDARSVHMHLLGRSRLAASPNLKWGEAPDFPQFSDRFEWAAKHERLTPAETLLILECTRRRLIGFYGFDSGAIDGGAICTKCGYPGVGGGCTEHPARQQSDAP